MSILTSPNFLTCPIEPVPEGSPSELPPPASAELPDSPPKKRRHWGRWIVLFLFLILCGLASPAIYGGVRAALAARTLVHDLESMKDQVLARDFVGATASLNAAQIELTNVRDGVRWIGVWRVIPWVDRQTRDLDQVIQVGETSLSGAQEMVGVASTLNEVFTATSALDTGVAPHRSFSDLTRDEKRAILSRLNEQLPRLRIAREKTAIALASWQRLSASDLSPLLRRALQPLADNLPQASARLDEGVSLLEVALPLAGYPTEKNYLVLLQNSDEMRPTGGFIGNIGFLKMDAGELVSVNFQDVYALDNKVIKTWRDPLPAPLSKFMDLKAWFFRDSNWSPDYPQTADRLLDAFARESAMAGATSTRFDGVIALEPAFFQSLLRFTGPLVVDGRTFTADNFFDILEYDVEIGFYVQGRPVETRKDIVKQVGERIIASLLQTPSSRWPELLDLVTQAFVNKDILITSTDRPLQRLLDARNWSGRTQTLGPDADFFWVVDANLGGLKTDGVMDKQIRYAINMDAEGGPAATVVLHYRNTNKVENWRYSRYRDYVRVYVPDGSELLSSSGSMKNDLVRTGGKFIPGTVDVMHELGKTAFGAFWSLEPGETRDLSFTFRLSPALVTAIQNGQYRLYAQKQPGATQRLTINHNFGKNVRTADPAEDPAEFGDSSYRLEQILSQDRLYRVTF